MKIAVGTTLCELGPKLPGPWLGSSLGSELCALVVCELGALLLSAVGETDVCNIDGLSLCNSELPGLGCSLGTLLKILGLTLGLLLSLLEPLGRELIMPLGT